MYPNGIVYQSGKSRPSGETKLTPGLIVKLVYHLLRGVGAGLIAFAVVGVIFTFWPVVKEEISYKPRHIGFGDLIERSRAEDFGLDPYFSIYIPKINAKARVIPNVDAGNREEYMDALSEGVAHAKGTNFPGQGKSIYLFSHSTDSPLNFARYNAIFFLLRKLSPGDRVVVYFMGQEHDYVVTDKIVTSADDTVWLNPPSQSSGEAKGERLILQTCDPPGTSWNRLIVVAKPI
jgi:LPXTG-site transpeptidase (sortase) family protein